MLNEISLNSIRLVQISDFVFLADLYEIVFLLSCVLQSCSDIMPGLMVVIVFCQGDFRSLCQRALFSIFLGNPFRFLSLAQRRQVAYLYPSEFIIQFRGQQMRWTNRMIESKHSNNI